MFLISVIQQSSGTSDGRPYDPVNSIVASIRLDTAPYPIQSVHLLA